MCERVPPVYVPPVYCSEVVQLTPFLSEKEAKNWLEKNRLNTNDTPLLIPFKNKTYNCIEFLKPKGERLRIMGAGNGVKDKIYTNQVINWTYQKFSRDFIPHIGDLDGETITIEKDRPIIIYEKGTKSVGEKFARLFRSLSDTLKKRIEEAQTNDKPRLKLAEIVREINALAVNLPIKAGMSYILIEENGVENLYRLTFHRDVNNKNLKLCLIKEADERLSKPVRLHYNKKENNHLDSLLIDWAMGTVFAIITAIGAGFVGSIFLPVFISAPIAVITFVTLSFSAFYKAVKDNVKTTEFGETEIEVLQSKAVTTSMNGASVCQVNETPTRQQNSASVPQQYSEFPALKNRAQALSRQTAIPMASFFHSGLKSVSTFIKNPKETALTLVKIFELENIVKPRV